MENYIIEHVEPESKSETKTKTKTETETDGGRLYAVLKAMDRYMNPVLSSRVSIDAYARKLVSNADLFYAVYSGKDCGHCAVYMNAGRTAFITSFGVLPEFQGKGIANALMKAVLLETNVRGIRRIELEVHRDNKAALCLYCKVGFQISMAKEEFFRMGKELGTNISRTVLCVSQRCTLRCKLCLAFIPYYDKPKDLSLKEVRDIMDIYFKVVDSVETFTVTGGEPLMNKELAEILKCVCSYKKKIKKSIDFVTNGTLDIPEEVLDIFEMNAGSIRVILSDYGELSPKIESISKELEKRNLTYRISNFHGEDLYFDGWIDFRDHSKKIDDIKLRDEHGKSCVHRSGRYFVINDGELHSCSRSYWRMKNGIIPKTDGEYVALMDDTISLEKKREDLLHMCSQASSTSCGYCVGLKNDVPRHYPAEQL